ncbi:MAG: transposase, partial [Deltaproteobacteria bacterium]|nr:transposase [Deltaproteobacteria bacterium]
MHAARCDRSHQARLEKSKPGLDELFGWCTVEAAKVLDQTPISTAIRYALNQREALSRFLDDG